jgi:ABC-type branched-subunit amino acid transport system substrate-binding protein
MHISAVRTALAETLSGQVPYIYTPLYEGGERHHGVYCLGETPDEQLRPALAWLSTNRRAQRWAMIGNDYVWPRHSHALARRYIGDMGGSVLADRYLPLGTEDFDELLDHLARSGADAVLLSLVGQDAVNFNRDFAARGLDRHMVRLSMAMDENMLLAIGPENTEGLYAAAGYFANVATDGNLSFIERYRARFGARAPVLSALGQSIYEGFGLLEALDRDHFAPSRPLEYSPTRGASYLDNGRRLTPIHLAEADGIEFRLLRNLAGTGFIQAN